MRAEPADGCAVIVRDVIFFARRQAGHRLAKAGAVLSLDQIVKILARELVIGHPEHALGGAGGEQDIAIFIDLNDQFRHGKSEGNEAIALGMGGFQCSG